MKGSMHYMMMSSGEYLGLRGLGCEILEGSLDQKGTSLFNFDGKNI
jgi:hypothetical protein